MTTATTQRCFKCEEDKPLDEFPRNRTRPSGYGSMCKACQREYMRHYNRARAERWKNHDAENPRSRGRLRIKQRTPFTWERRLAFRDLLLEYFDTGEWVFLSEVRG